MAKVLKHKKAPKSSKSVIKAEIISKLTEALKEYSSPKFSKKLAKKIEKAGKSIAPLALKGSKHAAKLSKKKSSSKVPVAVAPATAAVASVQ
jgi:hypothetical protein